MPIMKEKLIRDFFEADNIDKLMVKGQLDLETGIYILKDMINDVENDISTMDKEACGLLKKEINAVDLVNKRQKEELIKKNPEFEDSIEERSFKLGLLRLDHKKYKRILLFIQNLCYKKGWFD